MTLLIIQMLNNDGVVDDEGVDADDDVDGDDAGYNGGCFGEARWIRFYVSFCWLFFLLIRILLVAELDATLPPAIAEHQR